MNGLTDYDLFNKKLDEHSEATTTTLWHADQNSTPVRIVTGDINATGTATLYTEIPGTYGTITTDIEDHYDLEGTVVWGEVEGTFGNYFTYIWQIANAVSGEKTVTDQIPQEYTDTTATPAFGDDSYLTPYFTFTGDIRDGFGSLHIDCQWSDSPVNTSPRHIPAEFLVSGSDYAACTVLEEDEVGYQYYVETGEVLLTSDEAGNGYALTTFFDAYDDAYELIFGGIQLYWTNFETELMDEYSAHLQELLALRQEQVANLEEMISNQEEIESRLQNQIDMELAIDQLKDELISLMEKIEFLETAIADIPSLWEIAGEIAWGGTKGVGQSGLNAVNGIQDSIIGIGNLPAMFVNVIAWTEEKMGFLPEGSFRVPYIPSPDWSRGLITEEYGSGWTDSHNWSKGLGAFGLELLFGTKGASSARTAAREATEEVLDESRKIADNFIDDAAPSKAMTPQQQALKELVDEATLGGRKPLPTDDAEIILDWADEIGYPGFRAKPGDVANPSNWKAMPDPHIHIPGAGRGGHVPVQPGVRPR